MTPSPPELRIESHGARSRPVSPPAAFAGALLAVAGGAWLVTGNRMSGMGSAPGADLGGVGWFAVSWMVMMAAMMLPSLLPGARTFARAGQRSASAFVLGYLAAWAAAGLVTYLLAAGLRALHPAFLAWDHAGRYLAASVILAAAAYQFTGAKTRCLTRCRIPHLAEGNSGSRAAGRAALRHGASCIGCCAGLMAALFALGVMNLTWMLVITALIAVERLSPRPRPAVYAVAITLAILAIWMAIAPADLPGLTLPVAMHGM